MLQSALGRDDTEILRLVDICNNIRKSFKPYFRFPEQTQFKANVNNEFNIFINFLSSKPVLGVTLGEVIPLLQVAACASLLWARYI